MNNSVSFKLIFRDTTNSYLLMLILKNGVIYVNIDYLTPITILAPMLMLNMI